MLGAATALLLACGAPSSVDPPPSFDVSLVDPRVADLLREMAADVVADPSNPELRGDLGLALEANAMRSAAIEAYHQAALRAPGDPRWPYHAASVRAVQGDFAGALEELGRATALDGSYAPAHRLEGQWLFELGRLDEAERSFRRAVETDANDAGARAGLARVYLQTERQAQAEPLLQQLIGRTPFDAYVRSLLAAVYRQSGRIELARTEVARLGRPVQPSWPDPWRDDLDEYRVGYAADFKRAMRLLGRRRFEEAIPILESLRDQQPREVTVLSNLGAAYLDAGRVDNGMRTLQQALTLAPDHFSVHLNLSRAFEMQGDPTTALGHVDRALTANPYLSAAHVRRGILLAGLKRFDEAAAAIEEAARLNPQDPQLQQIRQRVRQMRAGQS